MPLPSRTRRRGSRERCPLPAAPDVPALLHLDDRALVLELLLELGGLFLVDAFLDGLAAGLDEILRLLETEASDGAHFFDDVDLLLAARLEDDRELGLLLRSRGRGCAGCGRNSYGSSSRHAPL